MQLCYNTCFNLTSGPCSSQWNGLYQLANTSSTLRWFLQDLDCSNTYYDANYADNRTCWNAQTDINITVTSPVVTTSSTLDGGKHYQEDLLIIIVTLLMTFEAVLLLIFIAAAFIVGCIAYRRRKGALHTFANPNQSSVINFP